MNNTPMLANWVQIEMGKTFQAIKSFLKNNYNFYVVETCSKVGF